MQCRLHSGGETITVDLSASAAGHYRCRILDRECDVEIIHATHETIVVRIDGRLHRTIIARDGAGIAVGLGGVVHRFFPESAAAESALAERSARPGNIIAPMPGKVLDVLVAPGNSIDGGQALMILEAMKMEHTLAAAGKGTVTAVLVEPGQMVDGGDVLLEIDPEAPEASETSASRGPRPKAS